MIVQSAAAAHSHTSSRASSHQSGCAQDVHSGRHNAPAGNELQQTEEESIDAERRCRALRGPGCCARPVCAGAGMRHRSCLRASPPSEPAWTRRVCVCACVCPADATAIRAGAPRGDYRFGWPLLLCARVLLRRRLPQRGRCLPRRLRRGFRAILG